MRRAPFSIGLFACLFTSTLALGQETSPKHLRAGMIGLDTSHVVAFTRIFNKPDAAGDLATVKIVAGYPGGTDIPASRDRVGRFTEQLRGMGIEIVDTIPKLLERVDVVLLESVDGRIHLQEARQVILAKKPLFIDKPLAGSLADSIAIAELAKQHKVPFFSSSSSRFGPGLAELKKSEEVGTLTGADVWGPCSYQAGTPDLFFYGIHGVEALFTLMGTGCESVSRVQARDADIVTGVWQGGRVGTYRGLKRNNQSSGAVGFGTNGIVKAGKGGSYEDLCQAIARFFQTGQPPVSPEETIEIMAFMEAADVSRDQGGKLVSIADVMAKAKVEADAKLKQ
jgi:predicted dehydrogenase